MLDDPAISGLWEQARAEVAAAVETAQAAPPADPADLGLDEAFAG